MSGIVELEELLKSMLPELQKGEFVFCTVDKNVDYYALKPVSIFEECEGTTLILPVENALKANIPFSGRFKQITLTVHSSLDAVGLTAAVATKLGAYNISANVVAAFYHDHIFVQSEKAQQALVALKEFNVK